MKPKTVIVIGSGPGGSAIAALMQHEGHKTTLLEKNDFIGGKCSSLSQKGFVVDTGVHMFGRGPNGPFGQVASILGEKLEWCLKEPMIDAHLSGKGSVMITHSRLHPIGFLSMLKSNLKLWMRPQPIRSMKKTFSNHTIGDMANFFKKVLNPNFPYLSEYEDITVKDFFTSLTDSEDVLKFIHAQTMITMVTPWHRASLADFLFVQTGTVRSKAFGYPTGASGAIPGTFLRAFRKDGGTIKTGYEVAKIEVDGGKVKGVTSASGEFMEADTVISNAGIHRTLEMADVKSFPSEYTERVKGLKLSEAFIATKYFLSRKITSMTAPCMFHIPDMNPFEMFQYLETGDIPPDLYLFITVPSKSDPNLAPLGKELLIVGVPAPSDLSRVNQCEKLLDLAESIAENKLFPETRGAIIEKQRSHIAHTARLTGRSSGECIGLAQEVGQTGTKKPSCETPVKGLYLVGSDAGGKGIGTECAADSALYLYNLLK